MLKNFRICLLLWRKCLTEAQGHERRTGGCRQAGTVTWKQPSSQNPGLPAARYHISRRSVTVICSNERDREILKDLCSLVLLGHAVRFSFSFLHHHPSCSIWGWIFWMFSVTKESNSTHLYIYLFIYFSLPPVCIVKLLQRLIWWNKLPSTSLQKKGKRAGTV